jgi:hypothetical protein
MVKCANCEKPADYTNADPGVNPVNYCASCLPTWLRQRASAGHFPLVQSVEQEETIVEEEPAPVKKKTSKSTE